ncbi:MAG: hypothetical protein GY841_01670 [FCB group bacterium]|nr:hypothetical protein [FCB group bacterium]
MMKRLFGSIFDLRRGEFLITALMFAGYYLFLVTYYFLKPARDSLFLVKVDPLQLPVVFIITALVTVPVVSLYSRAGRSLRLNQLITGTLAVLIVNLLILRWLIQWDEPWVYYLFYTWVSIYGALTIAQFWLLANAVYNAAQAKRIFVLLGLGGILGAFTGGQVTSLIIDRFGIHTPDLLFFCVGFLIVGMVLVNIIWRLKAPEDTFRKRPRHREKKKEKLTEVFALVRRSRHLSLIIGLIAMTMMVASFVDYQFKVISSDAYTTTESLTAFLGRFYGWLSLVSFALQLLFTYRFLRVLGVGGVIFFLPIGLFIGSAAMLIYPGLLAAVLLRGADGSLKYSIDKTGRELLFLPIPLELKKRTKVFIDMFVDRIFRGLAGGLLLLCTLILGLSVRELSVVVLVLIAGWIIMAVMMRREYVNTFRKAIDKRQIDQSELTQQINDAQSVGSLVTALQSDSERQIIYALNVLDTVKNKHLIGPVTELLTHSSAEIRSKALKLLRFQDDVASISEMDTLLHDDDSKVRREAINFLCEQSDVDRLELIGKLLADDDIGIRSAALGCIAQHGAPEEKELVTTPVVEAILEYEGAGGESYRAELASAFSWLQRPGFISTLQKLMNDDSPQVVRQTIISLGRLKNREHLPWLINKLGDQEYRSVVRRALAEYGADILGTLNDYLMDGAVAEAVRKNIPRVISDIPVQASVDILAEDVNRIELRLNYHLVKALNRMRNSYPDLKFDKQLVQAAVIDETRSYYEIAQMLHLQGRPDNARAALLEKALIEQQNLNLEQIFRFLGLSYPARDIYNAYLGLISDRRTLRANAVEFLDNLLHIDIKKFMTPILDDNDSIAVAASWGRQLFNFRFNTNEQALMHLIRGRNNWLKACAIYNCEGVQNTELKKLIAEAATDPDPVVRETAELMANK